MSAPDTPSKRQQPPQAKNTNAEDARDPLTRRESPDDAGHHGPVELDPVPERGHTLQDAGPEAGKALRERPNDLDDRHDSPVEFEPDFGQDADYEPDFDEEAEFEELDEEAEFDDEPQFEPDFDESDFGPEHGPGPGPKLAPGSKHGPAHHHPGPPPEHGPGPKKHAPGAKKAGPKKAPEPKKHPGHHPGPDPGHHPGPPDEHGPGHHPGPPHEHGPGHHPGPPDEHRPGSGPGGPGAERGFGFGPGAGFGSGPVPGFGLGFGFDQGGNRGRRGGFGRGRRGRRGDVRAAILTLLAERPMHGYEMIQEIAERSEDLWRPSAGSVYPTLQMLDDEGLIGGSESEGTKRLFELTDEGRVAAEKIKSAPWEQITQGADRGQVDLREALGQLFGAVSQSAYVATAEQQQRIVAIRKKARREIYSMLAESD